ncbi:MULTISPECIES: DUF2784 domain-containing protein [unclassified Nonomuraea]|uniref:DUF2784 domain-containing protein n=1 Tax=Nonomuraea sp. NPDC047529 TaxID=3155623 RepID=UPI0033C65188
MMYRLLAYAVMVTHFAFLAYVAVGGFVAWRWRRTIYLHLAAVGWAVVTLVTRVDCPLTVAEDWARRKGGLPGLPPSGFVDHYIQGVLYPEQYANLVRLGLTVLVLFSYVGYVLRRQ